MKTLIEKIGWMDIKVAMAIYAFIVIGGGVAIITIEELIKKI